MQRLPRKAGEEPGAATAAVDGVADERVPREGEVDADLVGTPGLQPALDQSSAPVPSAA